MVAVASRRVTTDHTDSEVTSPAGADRAPRTGDRADPEPRQIRKHLLVGVVVEHLDDNQLQPLVEPQLGQAWQEPARIICTPHCMHIGASLARGVARGTAASRTIPPGLVMSLLGATGATPRSSCFINSSAEGTLFGSEAISVPVRVSMTLSSTPGNVGCSRSSMEKMPSSARSS